MNQLLVQLLLMDSLQSKPSLKRLEDESAAYDCGGSSHQHDKSSSHSVNNSASSSQGKTNFNHQPSQRLNSGETTLNNARAQDSQSSGGSGGISSGLGNNRLTFAVHETFLGNMQDDKEETKENNDHHAQGFAPINLLQQQMLTGDVQQVEQNSSALNQFAAQQILLNKQHYGGPDLFNSQSNSHLQPRSYSVYTSPFTQFGGSGGPDQLSSIRYQEDSYLTPSNQGGVFMQRGRPEHSSDGGVLSFINRIDVAGGAHGKFKVGQPHPSQIEEELVPVRTQSESSSSSGGMSRLQDAMFSKLRSKPQQNAVANLPLILPTTDGSDDDEEGKSASYWDKQSVINNHEIRFESEVIATSDNKNDQKMNNRAASRRNSSKDKVSVARDDSPLTPIGAGGLLQAVIICQPNEIEKIVKPISKPASDSDSDEDEQPIVTYDDTTQIFCRNESLIVFQSVVNENFQTASPRKELLDTELSPPTGITQFEKDEYNQVMRQYHKLRQQQQVRLGNKQDESAFDMSRALSMETQNPRNVISEKNMNDKVKIAEGDNSIQIVVEVTNEHNQQDKDISHQLKKSKNSGLNEGTEVEKSHSPIGVPLKRSVSSSSSDSFSSLSADIQNIITNTLKQTALSGGKEGISQDKSISPVLEDDDDEIYEQNNSLINHSNFGGSALNARRGIFGHSFTKIGDGNFLSSMMQGAGSSIVLSGNHIPNSSSILAQSSANAGTQNQLVKTPSLKSNSHTSMMIQQNSSQDNNGGSFMSNSTGKFDNGSSQQQQEEDRVSSNSQQNKAASQLNSQQSGKYSSPDRAGSISWGQNEVGVKQSFISNDTIDRVQNPATQQPWWYQQYQQNLQTVEGDGEPEMIFESRGARESNYTPSFKNQYLRGSHNSNDMFHNIGSIPNNGSIGAGPGIKRSEVVMNPQSFGMNLKGGNVQPHTFNPMATSQPSSYQSWGGFQPGHPQSYQQESYDSQYLSQQTRVREGANMAASSGQLQFSQQNIGGGRHGAIVQPSLEDLAKQKQRGNGFMPAGGNQFIQQQLQQHQFNAFPPFQGRLSPQSESVNSNGNLYLPKNPSFIPPQHANSQLAPHMTPQSFVQTMSGTQTQLSPFSQNSSGSNIGTIPYSNPSNGSNHHPSVDAPYLKKDSFSSGGSGSLTTSLAFKQSPGALSPTTVAYAQFPNIPSPPIGSSAPLSITMINQQYKTIISEDQKLAFLIQHSYTLSKDQAGCRRLQKKIDEQIQKNAEKGYKFANEMLSALLPMIGELMMDSFANYLIQKLNLLAHETQIDQIFQMIRPCFNQVANNKHGTRALQNLFKHIVPLTDKRSLLISESLKPQLNSQFDKVLELALNIHGNHVIQLCLDYLTLEEHKETIYNTVICNCAKIATDKHGCCVIQKILGAPPSKIQRALVNVSIAQLDQLINDQYGNYVVQQILNVNKVQEEQFIGIIGLPIQLEISCSNFPAHACIRFTSLGYRVLLKYNNKEINVQVASFICDNLQYYCTQKISSNVVESAVRSPDSPDSQILFFKFLMKNQIVLKELMLDQYGNYVIQAIFQQARDYYDQTFFNQFFKCFEAWIDELSRVNFGKKFIIKINQLGVHLQGGNSGSISEEPSSMSGRVVYNQQRSMVGSGVTDSQGFNDSITDQSQLSEVSKGGKFKKLKNQAAKGFRNFLGGGKAQKDEKDQGYNQSHQSYQMGGALSQSYSQYQDGSHQNSYYSRGGGQSASGYLGSNIFDSTSGQHQQQQYSGSQAQQPGWYGSGGHYGGSNHHGTGPGSQNWREGTLSSQKQRQYNNNNAQLY